VQLADEYTFSWNITSSTIIAQIDLQAVSWVGFGLSDYSEFGLHGMPYADIIVSIFNSSGELSVNDFYR
jgi:hypothetical protein